MINDSQKNEIDTVVSQFLKDNSVPGAMISVQQGGSTVFSNGYGIQDPSNTMPSSSTTFQIDSLTKVFTAMAVLKMYEDGKISALTDSIGTYVTNLSEGVSLPSAWSDIQIIELLAMVSGIPDYFSLTDTYLEILENVAGMPMSFSPPATCYQYSNPNYMLLGVLVDQLSSRGFSGYVQKHIFEPLGMSGTGLIDFSSATNPAMPYESGGKVTTTWRSPDCGYSAGGFASTMSDLELFAEGLANGAILSSANYQLMWNRFTVSGCQCTTTTKITSTNQFGLGWLLEEDSSGVITRAQKNGGGAGWGSELIYSFPCKANNNTPVSVCAMINADGLTGQLALQVLEVVQES